MNISEELPNGRVEGLCQQEFQAVADQFITNFDGEEVGASLCITIGGETVVDLWGGLKAGKDPEHWEEDTVSVVFSCTKGATALCAHHLIDQGSLDIHEKVGFYWPEFATNGKEDATVEMMLNHSVGVPALREPIKEGGYCDWDYMVDRLSAEAPFWKPGTRNGYHMMTFGWTVGELVRRVSGKSLGTYFREHIAEPLALDFSIGLPEDQHARVSRMQRWRPKKGEQPAPFTLAMLNDRNSLQYLAFMNSGKHKTDSTQSYLAELGGGGGIANARALAGMYAPLANGGIHKGIRIVSEDHIQRMRSVSVATLEDATLLMPSRFGLGFMRSMDNRHRASGNMETMILGRGGFGHAGAGGSVGFADPEAALSLGYSMNQMGAGILVNQRGQALVDATYRCLGYRTNSPGYWIR
ncbi:MAG: CubicO group peptidase (beta-lactamase class C family) [Candidatus Azotimanducaceae bacterium]